MGIFMKLQRACKPSPWIRIGFLVLLLCVVVWLTSCEKGDAQEATMEELLEKALEPVGSTMYIWGGGWDSEEGKAGKSATQMGVSPRWAEFAGQQDASYNFVEHMGEAEMGLDCSGYVGWVMYNLFENQNNQEGYVTFSTLMAENFAARGWGKLIKNPHAFLPGDIVSMQGHVWICLGTCQDGSVLLVHSSPPGVSVCGTEGAAAKLAEEYMSVHYPDWQEKYPKRTVPSSYLENVEVLRWNSETLKDAEEFQNLGGEDVLKRAAI